MRSGAGRSIAMLRSVLELGDEVRPPMSSFEPTPSASPRKRRETLSYTPRMSDDRLKAAYRAAKQALAGADQATVERELLDVISASVHNLTAAEYLSHALTLPGWPGERRVELAAPLTQRWSSEPRVMAPLANFFEVFVDLRLLNDAPPSDESSQRLLQFAAREFEKATGEARHDAAYVLFSVARLSGRAADGLCERAIKAVIEHTPDAPNAWYDYGLFLKTRGRFAEGLAANQRAALLRKETDESTTWNLGICATGAGEGQVALDVWTKNLGAKLRIGDDGLPTGRWDEVKVRLAERPLAERTAKDDSPGAEETVWLERLSPCHGRVLNATSQDLGVDFDDVVLFDGASITSQEIQGRLVYVFPHLATLRKSDYRIFRFAAYLPAGVSPNEVNKQLPGGTIFYSHTHSVVMLCRQCALDGKTGQCGHREKRDERAIRGKLCIAPGVSLPAVDQALAKVFSGDAWLLSPPLAEGLGDHRRARAEQKKVDALSGE